MSTEDAIFKVSRGKIGSLPPHTLADEFAKIVSRLTGEKYFCTVKSISYDKWDAKMEIEFHKSLLFETLENKES